MTGRLQKWITRLALAVPLLALILFTAEIGARTFICPRHQAEFSPFPLDHRNNPELYAPDPDLFWTMRPNQSEGINRFGLRGELPDEPKQRFRILCLGGSITYGFHLTTEQALPARLGAALGPGVETINAGVNGYTIVQGERWFARDLATLRPDLLIADFGYNDAMQGTVPDLAQPRAPNVAWRFHRRWGRFCLARLLISPWTVEPQFGVTRVAPDDYRDTCRKLAQDAHDAGARTVFLLLDEYNLAEDAFFSRRYKPPAGLPVVDLTRAFDGLEMTQVKSFYMDGMHMSADGIERIAAYLADELRRRKMVDLGR